MASYRDWNQALVSYFTSGIPLGTKVYLSVDDDVLDRIGREFDLTLTASNYREDFCACVRKQVIDDRQVNLTSLRSYGYGIPKGVAFLGATVLAAYQMGDEEEISQIQLKYFSRLRELLGWNGDGRPRGMKTGDEKALWEEWNKWLERQGFLLSAHSGTGKYKYINYPISQTLLRCIDKNQLVKLFHQKQWKKRWDAQTLFTFIRCEAANFSKHLRNLLTEEYQHRETVAEAIYEVYEQWQEEGYSQPGTRGSRSWNRNIFAGLYRAETNPFLGVVDYLFYPKQRRGQKLESVEVQCQNEVHTLRIDEQRPGWYFPAWSISANELDDGCEYKIKDPLDRGVVILPYRDFWILIPDPDNPDSGVYASWGKPSLDVPFILLCKQEILPDIQRLRDRGLLNCDSPIPAFNNSSWFEIHQCQIISLDGEDWEQVFINNQELKDALQPVDRLWIGFSGGLRDRNMGAWVEGYSPNITLFSRYQNQATLQIIRTSDNQNMIHNIYQTGTPISHKKNLSPGNYIFKMTCAGESKQRNLQIIGWDELSIETPKQPEWGLINCDYKISGCVIDPV